MGGGLRYHPVLGDADREIEVAGPTRLLVVGDDVPGAVTVAEAARQCGAEVELPLGIYVFDDHRVEMMVVTSGSPPGAPDTTTWEAAEHPLQSADRACGVTRASVLSLPLGVASSTQSSFPATARPLFGVVRTRHRPVTPRVASSPRLAAMVLRWSGKDGFDDKGRRVAAVARYRDWTIGDMHYATPGPGKAYWVAFVGNDYVLVDDAPGHWAGKNEAKAAAEAAYRQRRQSGTDVPAAAPRPARQRSGCVAFIRDLLVGWQAARRDRR